ncbi:LysR family substrate-binding domain-containing protein [Myceligenerans indicum]|uniref:LysR family substrate-binding domain-containing protein n=1 Tax=Myceligenerans indicum TaxID=2593663 RepID=UPI0027DBAE81|nr:LysR family substrate-binding domain-containing protein [Myceligenerans indicum]
MSETFHLAYVPGATPGKWARVWRERLPDVALELVQVDAPDAAAALRDGRADAALARLPVDTDVFSRIPLYEELAVVCVHRDHLFAALEPDETVASADLADETVWLPQDDVLYRVPGSEQRAAEIPGRQPVDPDGVPLERPATAADALAIVGAGAGITVLPMSLARLHHRKDVQYRPLDDGPTAPVGLVWPADRTTDLVEEMIGIVRGRTVNSSRGRGRSSRPDAAGSAQPGSSATERTSGSQGGKRGGRPPSGRGGGRGRGAARGRGGGPTPNRGGRGRRRKEK